MVPEPDVAGLMRRLDDIEESQHRLERRWPLMAAAAAAVAALAVALFVGSNVAGPKRFETAFGSAEVPQMNLVFDITFAGTVDDNERARILNAFDLPTDGEKLAEGRYRIEMARPVAPPEEIHDFTEALAAAEGVVSAEVTMPPPAN